MDRRRAEGVTALADWPKVALFGIPIHVMTMDDAIRVIDETIARRDRLLIGVVNAAKLVNMRRSPVLRDSVLSSHMVLADGMAVVWALRLLGRRLPERVAGIDMMLRMLKLGDDRGYRVFCLGASEEVSSLTAERIAADYPGVVIAGRHYGYFTQDGEAEVVTRIKQARADMLFVAMSPPKKEEFLARWFEELDVPVCHGVGGAFDVLAGKTKRAPLRWQRWGMEWLYRVFQEPRRMWRRYLVTNTVFGWMLLGEIVRKKKARRHEGTKARRNGGTEGRRDEGTK